MTMSANVCPYEINSLIEGVRFFANTIWVNKIDSFRLANQRLWLATKHLDRLCSETDINTDRSTGITKVDVGRVFGSEETKCQELFVQNKTTGTRLLPEVEEALRKFTFEVGTKNDSRWTNEVEAKSSALYDHPDSSSRLISRTSDWSPPCPGSPSNTINCNSQNWSSDKLSTDLSDAEDDLEELNPYSVVATKVKTTEVRELQRKITSIKVKRIWHNSQASSGVPSSKTPLGFFDSHLNPTTLNANVPEFFPNSSNSPTTPEDVRRPFVFPSSFKDSSYQDALFPYKNETKSTLFSSPISTSGRHFQQSLREPSNYLPIPLPPTKPSSGSSKTSPKDESVKRTSMLRSELSYSARSSHSAETRSITTKNVTNWRVSTSTSGDTSPPVCTSSFWSSFTRHNKTNSSTSNKFKRESYASLSARSSISQSSSPSKESGFFQARSNIFRSSGVKLSEDASNGSTPTQHKPTNSGHSESSASSPYNSPRSNKIAGQESHMLLSTSRSCKSTHTSPGIWEENPNQRLVSSGETLQQNMRSSAPPSLFSMPIRPACCTACPMIPPPLISRSGVCPRNIPVYQRPQEFYLHPDVVLHAEKKHHTRGADHSNLIVLTGANKRHFHDSVNTRGTFSMLNELSSVAMERDFPPLIMVDPEPNPPGVDDDEEILQQLNGNHDHDFQRQMDWLKKYYSSRVEWFTHASLLSDELALIEEQTVMEALEDMERDCNVAFPPIGNATKRSPQKKPQLIGISTPQALSETSLDLTPQVESRKEVVISVQPKLSYKDVLANPAPLKSAESFHELEKLPTEELKPSNDSFQLLKPPDDSCVANPKNQEQPTKQVMEKAPCPTNKTPTKPLKRPPKCPNAEEASVPRVEVRDKLPPSTKTQPPSLLSLGPIKKPTMVTNCQSQHDLRAASKVTPATLSKSYTKVDKSVKVKDGGVKDVVEPVDMEEVAPTSPRHRGSTKMVLLPPKTASPDPEVEDSDSEVEGDGPLLVLADPAPGLRLLVQQVYKEKMVAPKEKKKTKKMTVATPDDARNESGKVDTAVLATKPDPNEERTQVSIKTIRQPAKTTTHSEPSLQSPIKDKVQETWDTAEVNAASTPITTSKLEKHPPHTATIYESTTAGEDSEKPFLVDETMPGRLHVSRSSSTTAALSEEGRRSSDALPTKPVWMKQKKKRMSSSNKKKRVKGSKRPEQATPSTSKLCDCDKFSCCKLNDKWMQTGNVKYHLFETVKNMETEILRFKDFAIETRDRMASEEFSQPDDLLCLSVAEKMKNILPKMAKIFQDFDSGYITCVNCDLGKMIFEKIIGLKKDFQNFETQLLLQGLHYFMCYVKEFVEPSEMDSEPLSYKILSTFKSEYAGSVLLYRGYPKAFYLQSLYVNLKEHYKTMTNDNISTIYVCVPSTTSRVILLLKHSMMDLKLCLGTDKEVPFSRSSQVVVNTPSKDDIKTQRKNSRRLLKRELFKPAPVPRVQQSKEVNFERINENKNKGTTSSKGIATQRETKPSGKKPVNNDKSSKNSDLQNGIHSISEENIGSKTNSKVLKEPIDERETIRREMERESRNRLPKCYRLRKAARSTSSPAVMIGVKSHSQNQIIKNARVCDMCKECFSHCQQIISQRKRCLTTDDLKQPLTFKNRKRNVTGIFDDVPKTPPNVINDLLKILFMEDDEEQTTNTKPSDDQPFTDETYCSRKIQSIRNIVNKYETCLPQTISSNIFLRIERFLEEGLCSFQVIKREQPLVWPRNVNPTRIVGMVETLENQFILDRSQVQLCPRFRVNESECNTNEELPRECDIVHLEEDIAGPCHLQLKDENDQKVELFAIFGTNVTTNTLVEEVLKEMQTCGEIKHLDSSNSNNQNYSVKCIQDEDSDSQNSTNQNHKQTQQESIRGKTSSEVIPSTWLVTVSQPSQSNNTTTIDNQIECCLSSKTNAGETGKQTAAVCREHSKGNSSKTDLFMSAVKRKMSTKMQQKTPPIPDLVPADYPSLVGRNERSSGQTNRQMGMRHHERTSENTSCTLY